MNHTYRTEVGEQVSRRGVPIYVSKAGDEGFVVFGPYVKLDKGHYTAIFHIDLDRIDDPCPVVCGRVDVAVNKGAIIKHEGVFTSDRADSRTLVLPFSLDQEEEVEFRVYTTGKVAMRCASPTFAVSEQGREHEQILGLHTPPMHPFLTAALGDFIFAQSNGLRFEQDERSMIGNFGPLRFRIENLEDFQVVNEILVTNEYNFDMPFDVVFIDVGMNIGLTSLQAAYNKCVKRVVSFDPFHHPYLRALENFSLNGPVREKIEAFNVGLADHSETRNVYASSDRTIGTSIRGLTSGEVTEIALQDAYEALKSVIHAAKQEGLGVVIKLDCEGSEFSIMQRLCDTGLLRDVSVMMIEWHKWWSATLDRRTLISQLSLSGFSVFDRTTPANVFAGMLYAVRSTVGRRN